MDDCLKLSGRFKIRVKDEDGNVVLERKGENLVVVTGFELAAALIVDEAVAAVSHMAAGDGTTEPDEDETALVNELARVAVTTTRNGHIIEHTANFSGIGADISVSEFGLFNAASAGTMFARFITDTFTLFSGQSMDIVWEVRVGQ